MEEVTEVGEEEVTFSIKAEVGVATARLNLQVTARPNKGRVTTAGEAVAASSTKAAAEAKAEAASSTRAAVAAQVTAPRPVPVTAHPPQKNRLITRSRLTRIKASASN